MSEVRALRSVLAHAQQGEGFVFRLCDGHCSGAEFAWLPVAGRWVWYDSDDHQTGSAESLTLIFSAEDGDESGLNRMPGLLTVELDGNTGLWVTSQAASDLTRDLPDDAEVYTLADPADGLVDVELVDA